MPRITLFGRSVDIAADDLFVPFSLLLSLRLIWLSLAIVSLSRCLPSNFEIYVIAHIASQGINIPLESVIILFSLSGSLKIPGLRRYCTVCELLFAYYPQPLLHVHVIFIFVDLLVSILGIAAIFGPPIIYPSSATSCEKSVIVYIIALWSSSTLLLWCTVITLFLYVSRRKARHTKFHKVLFSISLVVSKNMERSTGIFGQELATTSSCFCSGSSISEK
jgi:hypothetical protein